MIVREFLEQMGIDVIEDTQGTMDLKIVCRDTKDSEFITKGSEIDFERGVVKIEIV